MSNPIDLGAKVLSTVDEHLIEVHFARENITVERFSVTTTGWHNVWMMTKYGTGYVRTSEILLKADAIVWAKYIDAPVWCEIDDTNLIPLHRAQQRDVSRVVLHRNHDDMYDKDNPDTCGVLTRKVLGYGSIYEVAPK